ncbi:nifU-like protein 1, chloroplastic [Cynara cardunculus var. scolymus]|uniref:nifU-like protein 1, chloroplastic n=1 Tax=Cynara cardunculus var. scolymus TaxID=59895 RepID=UPI000D62C2DD|nr:nifU-like protein 1, chloroplastic [Cynara cardunculus var. scolymus]
MALATPILMSQPQFQQLSSTKAITQVTRSPVSIVITNRIRWVVPQNRRCITTINAMAGGGLYSAQQFELTPQNVDTVLDDVRPYLIADGGNVDVVSVEDGVVSLKLQGACGNCPSSTTTMKMGIERVLKEKFGDAVKDIVQVYDEQPAETTVEAVNGHLEILRPAIANFGGSVEVLSVEGGECVVKYTGPESIGSGVKAAIKEKFPDIVNVIFTG